MKSRLLFILVLISLLVSCSSKKYKFIVIVKDEGLFGIADIKEKEPKIITASSDSIAYLEAFEDFCIAQKVNRDMIEAYGRSAGTPIKFKLIDEEGDDISNSVEFLNKEQLEKEIVEKILLMKNSLKESKEDSEKKAIENFKDTAVVDSVKIEELKKYFKTKKDEFDPNGKVWYEPKSAPKYTNSNGIYCYFQTNAGKPSNLRFRVQYYADNWLFFSKVQFSIDDKAYEYIPTDTETDNGDGGMIWEWFDEQLTTSDKELITALANAKSAKMKFVGKQYYEIKTISKQQIQDIKRAVEYYNAMGGNY